VQAEYHPFLVQSRLLSFLREHGIPLTAYAPLAQGRAATDPTLARVGAKHGVPASQVAIAWLLEQGHVIAIPKAERRESQQANLDALSLRLDDEDRAAIAEIAQGSALRAASVCSRLGRRVGLTESTRGAMSVQAPKLAWRRAHHSSERRRQVALVREA
jgi:diketogulonate reductase-like aldo/keto reductase